MYSNCYDVLYIGSYRSNFPQRIYEHLGYYSPKTASLQLIHWAKPLFSKITVTYFPIEYSNLALHKQIEIAMCKTYIPMIGEIENDRIK